MDAFPIRSEDSGILQTFQDCTIQTPEGKRFVVTSCWLYISGIYLWKGGNVCDPDIPWGCLILHLSHQMNIAADHMMITYFTYNSIHHCYIHKSTPVP